MSESFAGDLLALRMFLHFGFGIPLTIQLFRVFFKHLFGLYTAGNTDAVHIDLVQAICRYTSTSKLLVLFPVNDRMDDFLHWLEIGFSIAEAFGLSLQEELTSRFMRQEREKRAYSFILKVARSPRIPVVGDFFALSLSKLLFPE